MGYGLSRFDKAAAAHLEPGEHIVGGTWARTPGGFAAERAFGLGGALAAQIGAADAGTMRLPKAFEVAVTEQRLLFFDRSAMTGRPSNLVAALPLTAVAVAEIADSRRGIERVEVRLRTGGSIDFEVAKLGARKLVDEFVACVNGVLAEQRRPARTS